MRKDLLRFSQFGQTREKMGTGQQKSLSKEIAVGKFTIIQEAAKKTLNLVKP